MKPHRGTSLLMDGNRGGGKAFAVWFSASPPSPLSKTPEKQSKHFYKEIYIVNHSKVKSEVYTPSQTFPPTVVSSRKKKVFSQWKMGPGFCFVLFVS